MKTPMVHLKGLIVLGTTAVVMLATEVSQAQDLKAIPPPMAYAKGQQFKNNPAAWNEFMTRLPHRTYGAKTAAQGQAPSFGGTWTQVTTNTDPDVVANGLDNPRLLTDGTVLFQEAGTPNFWKLTPDSTGGYVNGTWSQVASLPTVDGTQHILPCILRPGCYPMEKSSSRAGNTKPLYRPGPIWVQSMIRLPTSGLPYRHPRAGDILPGVTV